jgi:hypothetical protein
MVSRPPAQDHFVYRPEKWPGGVALAEEMIIREGRKKGEMLATKEVGKFATKDFLPGHDIRRGELEGIKFHGTPNANRFNDS